MKEETTPPTPFQLFAARRIAEFPTLYKNGDDVIACCIFGNRGDSEWENGVVVTKDLHYNPKTGRYTKYPLRMPIATAIKLLNSYKIPSIAWDTGGARAPINNIPKNADESFLEAIEIFLSTWGRASEEDWKAAAKAYSISISGTIRNESERKLSDYLSFAKQIPEWRAKVGKVRHFQQHGEIDPRTFMAEGI